MESYCLCLQYCISLCCLLPSKKWAEAFLELQWCRIINSEQSLDWKLCRNEYFFSHSHDNTEAPRCSVNYLEKKKAIKQWKYGKQRYSDSLLNLFCTHMWSSAAEYPNHSDHHVTWLSMVGCADRAGTLYYFIGHVVTQQSAPFIYLSSQCHCFTVISWFKTNK